MILRSGANTDIINYDGDAPLHVAARSGDQVLSLSRCCDYFANINHCSLIILQTFIFGLWWFCKHSFLVSDDFANNPSSLSLRTSWNNFFEREPLSGKLLKHFMRMLIDFWWKDFHILWECSLISEDKTFTFYENAHWFLRIRLSHFSITSHTLVTPLMLAARYWEFRRYRL